VHEDPRVNGTILLAVRRDFNALYAEAFAQHVPRESIRVWPFEGPLDDCECVVTYRPPEGLFARLPELRLIASAGAGADGVLGAAGLPTGVPIMRTLDPQLPQAMTHFVVAVVLRHLRRLHEHAAAQTRAEWGRVDLGVLRPATIGILGLGELGTHAARAFVALGYPVLGWSRTPRAIEGVECFAGDAGLAPMLARSEVLVCLLPLTPGTRRILNRDLFARLPRGAYVVNVGRGEHLAEDDLVPAIDSGQLTGAALDVFVTEPLPAAHAFWRHPKIFVTPHVATFNRPEQCAAQVVANLRRVRAGEPIHNEVHRHRGY
jgi:glyoxylate/hydroxypyruvate reductase